MLDEILQEPARYLLACPRIDLMDELTAYLRERAAALNIACPALRLCSSAQRGDVARQLRDAARDLGTSAHAVVVLTHEALKLGDVKLFADWHARIDEVPDGAASGSFSATASWQVLERIFKLERLDERWSQVVPREDGPTSNEILQDNFLRELAALIKIGRGPQGAIVDVHDWIDASVAGRRVGWLSVWTPAVLRACASITITGVSFDTSLCGLVTRQLLATQVHLRERRLVVPRAPVDVQICYFVDAHAGTTTYWASSPGRYCLNQICNYLSAIGGVGYWSGNEVVQAYCEHRFGGNLVKPKLSGTNSLIENRSCAIFYSNKARDEDDPLLNALGVSRDDIRRAREREDILQFVLRGALRNPLFEGV